MRGFAAAMIGLALFGLGCDSSADGMTSGSVSGTADATSTGQTTSSTGPETGAVAPGCGENLLEDPGFEGGTASEAWDDDSELFGTPICDATCTDDVGANPFTGDWWVWFGGVAQPDTASVRQQVFIPEGNAVLRFGFSVNAGAGTGNDAFVVVVDDDQQQLRVTDAQAVSNGGWRIIELDMSRFADGAEHTLSFEATISGAGVTNFFIDDVELLLCDDAGSSGGTGTGDGTGDRTGTGDGTGADTSTSTSG